MSLTPPLFTSAFADGPDITKLRPSDWNRVSGLLTALFGTANPSGGLLFRDSGAANGASWLEPVAAGSVLVSAGAAAAPAWSATPTLTSLQLAGAGQALLRLRDTDGVGYWDVSASDFFDQGGSGVHNHTLGLHFNEDGALLTHPRWGENWEPRYVPAAAPLGLLEKNWDFTSIDGLYSFRPFNFNVNLNTNLADMTWKVAKWSVIAAGDTVGTQESLKVYTPSRIVSMAGQLMVGASSESAPYPFELTGPTRGTVAAAIRPTTVAADDTMLYISPANVTGELKWIVAQSSVSGKAYALFQNVGAGGSNVSVLGGSGGDAWVRMLAGTDWSIGADRSDSGKWKLSQADTLGSNDRLTVTSAGVVGIPNLSGSGNRYVYCDANGNLVAGAAAP